MPTGPGIAYVLRRNADGKKPEVRPWVKATGKALENYGKNVAGGAKIVAGEARRFGRKVVSAIASPIVKELKMKDEADKTNKGIGEKLNTEYSGKVRRSTSDGSMR